MPSSVEGAKFRRRLVRAILLPVILLGLLTGFFLWQINRLVVAIGWVEHTDRVIAEANELQKILLDLETGMRGYLITGNPEFLAPYQQGRSKIEPAFDNLATRVSDNPAQIARLDELRALHGRWRVYAEDAVALRDAGGDHAARVNDGTGKRLMDAMRAQIEAFVTTEATLRDERTKRTNAATRNATLSAIIAALVLGGLLAFASRRELLTLTRSYTRALTSEQEGRERLRVTLASIGDAVIATDEEGRITFMNAVAQELTKWTEAEAAGRASDEVFNIINEATRAHVESPIVRVLREGVIVGLANHTKLIAKDGAEFFIDDSGAPIKDRRGRTIGAVLVFRDISERRATEAEQERLRNEQAQLQIERLALQDEIVRMQAERLAELSTPLIPVTNEVVIMPLIGTIDKERADQVLGALSKGVATSEARVAIVDITGVQTVDTHVAQTLINAAHAVRLLGAEVVLTGIRPRVAQALVGLGVNFTGLTTRSTLQRGINYALEQLHNNGDHGSVNSVSSIRESAS